MFLMLFAGDQISPKPIQIAAWLGAKPVATQTNNTVLCLESFCGSRTIGTSADAASAMIEVLRWQSYLLPFHLYHQQPQYDD
jgi:hypothetical protein